ncbi:SDR family NAD(P)-dependent oxidoreductase [Taibaiella helva]|uniref:SDR family NAD(P)-dependent oxidoreductase n=1 Tax=Taibaiella helva TaxID=2301235 RepID=UPI000E574DE2|nr:SDR family NAD(P)-dependent oxidoreductase [Taibaiella helva]
MNSHCSTAKHRHPAVLQLKQIAPKGVLLLTGLLLFLVSCRTGNLSRGEREKLSPKIFVITGASSGLGRGIALEAGRCRATVVLASRNRSELDKVASAIEAAGGRALVIPTDVSSEQQVERLADTVGKLFGRIDIWINNAGVAAVGRFWETPLADQRRVIDVNLNGVLYGSFYAMKQFIRQGSGVLINIASVESNIPTAYQAAYSASKAGVQNIGNTIRQELRLNGYKKIRVVTVLPYALDTPLWDHAAVYTGHAPRMMALDPPRKAVNVTLHACLRGKRSIAAGWKAKAALAAHRIAPGLVERIGSNMTHKYQATQTPEKSTGPGNLFHTLPTPGVEGGLKERMKKERKERKEATKQP